MFFNKKQNKIADRSCLPNHVGIIMDGNGRWAKQRGLPRTAGHAVGVKVFKKIVFYARDMGLKNLTVYAFSTENWKRPKEEVDKIMDLLDQMIDEAIDDFMNQKVRIRFLGDRDNISEKLLEKMDRVTDLTKNFDDTTLYIALNYGGRQEIVSAVKKISCRVKNGELDPDKLTVDDVGGSLYFDDFQDVDLVIRPSGEQRLSNFLLWQSAYAEFWYSDVLWPDFKPEHLEQAIYDFQKRNRRFGGI